MSSRRTGFRSDRDSKPASVTHSAHKFPKTMSEQAPSQPPLARHDSRLLDLAFGMDTTGSMSSYIRAACNNVRQIVEEIVAKESSDVRLALVEYRDHPPQDTSYVTQVHDFTPRVAEMRRWLQASTAKGGGDTPEAVADCLQELLKLSWRPEATKICVLISDAPPHGLGGGGDGFPNGCPKGLDPMTLARQLAEKGVTLYVAGCEPALVPYKDFFAAMAYVTGGQYVPLQAASALTPVIIGGAQEELSLEQFMDQVNERVEAEVQARGGVEEVDRSSLSKFIMRELNKKGARVRQLKSNTTEMGPVSDRVKNVSACRDLSAVREIFQPESEWRSRGEEARSRSRRSRSGSRERCRVKRKAKSASKSSSGSGSKASTSREAAEDVYKTEEGEIHLGQAERLVQKSLMRRGKKT